MIKKKIIFSGIQPSGHLTLGNYLGAIKNWIKIQHHGLSLFCIVDLHAITAPQEPETLKKNILLTAAAYIASGIDPEKSIIFQQSQIKEHTELAWILGCSTPIGWLNRMTQFKDKVGNDKTNASLGLFSYPTLMAADILLYHSTVVPVAEDQTQHLELTRDIAGAFNRKFQTDYFTVPEQHTISKVSARIMSLRDGNRKMSKSDPSDFSRINLSDSAELIAQKIKKAKTDDIAGIWYDAQKRPEITNLINIYCSLTDTPLEVAINYFKDMQTGQLKAALTEVVISELKPITSTINKLMIDQSYLRNILENGFLRAQSLAQETMNNVKKIVGLI